MLIDTHAHLNFNAYKDDANEVIGRSLKNNFWMINVGSQYSTSKRAVEIAEKYPEGVYAAIGLHPIHSEEEFDYKKYRVLANRLIGDPPRRRVVAIGEIGLDYKSEYVLFKERQKKVFLKQLDLAKELNLPAIFHCRMAHEDLIEILNTKYKIQDIASRGVIHCFTGTWDDARKYLEMGFYLGFNGIIFKLYLDEVIEKTPLDKILVETDCPYLTPPLPADSAFVAASAKEAVLTKAGPMTGRNEPLYVKYVAEKIAKIKKKSYEEISEITTQNAKKLFNLI